MTTTEIVVTLLVGFGSGLVGAFAGAWAQRFVYRTQREDERLDDLWHYQRVLQIVAEYYTNERRSPGNVDMGEAEKRVFRHFRHLPGHLVDLLELDAHGAARNGYEEGEYLWDRASALKEYLKTQQHPVRHRMIAIKKAIDRSG